MPRKAKKKIKNGHPCETANCKNQTDGNRRHCGTCRCRHAREKDEVRYFLNNLRRSAVRRGIPFTLQLEEFRTWAIQVGFRFGGGRGPSADSVDRIRNWEGYHINNIQKLTIAQNSSKYQRHDKHYKPVDTEIF